MGLSQSRNNLLWDSSPYAAESVSTLINADIIEGNGSKLNPLDKVTRAETAVFINRIVV
ncbi:S-layer homology domain-containing protein [Paenibacillus mucilaginosus]|uniref:S-layer homology domain-containing protein n=1 Tax=Paenibacillus mucilaginosus TaxID=61624 RepID=UPI003D1B810F